MELQADFRADFRLYFRNGGIEKIVVEDFIGNTAFDPLPEELDLKKEVERWIKWTMSQWRSVRLSDYNFLVTVEFKIDPSLQVNEFRYSVEYYSDQDYSVHPKTIRIEAPKANTNSWNELVPALREKKSAP
jgi:hypothetical protein